MKQVIYYYEEGGRVFLGITTPKFDQVGRPLGEIHLQDKVEVNPSKANEQGPTYIADLVRVLSERTGVKEISPALKEFLPEGFEL
jgi:hypothetical protein